MTESKKYMITKDEKSEVITYSSFDNVKGFKTKPKNGFKFEDMINVDEMVIINPSFIKKLVHKKCDRSMEKLIKLVSLLYDDDGDDDGPYMLALTELTKFSDLLYTKYQNYLSDKEFKLLVKKLDILKTEIMLRREAIFEQNQMLEENLKGKGGR